MSSKRTGQTIGQFNRSFRPYQSLYRISTEILVSNRNKKNSSFRSETIGDLPACCAHVLPLSLERFCHVSQTRCPFFFFFFSPFRGSAPPLFLLCSFTQCPLFHIISNVSFSICLFSFFLSLSFFVLCASTTTTHRGVAKNFYMGGSIRTMKVEIDDNEYHRCMDSLYFQVDMDLL